MGGSMVRSRSACRGPGPFPGSARRASRGLRTAAKRPLWYLRHYASDLRCREFGRSRFPGEGIGASAPRGTRSTLVAALAVGASLGLFAPLAAVAWQKDVSSWDAKVARNLRGHELRSPS
jgi:hypothetical protein